MNDPREHQPDNPAKADRRERRVRLAITLGDPAGIGPEVVAGALRARLESLGADDDVVVVGHLPRWRTFTCPIGSHLVEWTPGQPLPAWPAIGVHDPLPEGASAPIGVVSRDGGRHALAAIECAIELARRGEVDGIVTAPVAKEALSLAGASATDHTTLLSQRAGVRTVMCMVGGGLRVTLASVHVALRDAIAKLTSESLTETIVITAREMRDTFGIDAPRVAVCALNPHAGEHGLFGSEETTRVTPAIESARTALRKTSIAATVTGPHPADVVFARARSGDHDAVVALYHDQGLIPVKTLDFDGGVNVTLGLPFVRTSPDHGTAFDIAATPGTARPTSMLAACGLAIRLARAREAGAR